LSGVWVEPDLRDQVVDFANHWHKRTGFGVRYLTGKLGIGSSKFYDWRKRYGQNNAHNGQIPRDFWLEDWEIDAIVEFYKEHPDDGYRRCCYMMIDADQVAVSPATVYRVLRSRDAMRRWKTKSSGKGKGFDQPTQIHEHWHIDIAYLNICGTFYYLCSILDGCSRYAIHWEIRERMTEKDIEIILQRALEKFPGVTPRIISDNGPQFVARDFKEFIRVKGLSHVRTSPYYPQSNGKLERFNKTVKSESIRKKTPLSIDHAKTTVHEFVDYYNNTRLNSAIGYITPNDKLHGREEAIHNLRDQRLESARRQRKRNRRKQKSIEIKELLKNAS
jgi:putative transposase